MTVATVDNLDSWLAERERAAQDLAAVPLLAEACAGKNHEAAREYLTATHKRAPFLENVFLAGIAGKLEVGSVAGLTKVAIRHGLTSL